MAIYDFFLSRNGAPVTQATYVGHEGRLFYDSATGEIRISDGVTPGGNPIPITIATTTTAGAVRPGQGFTISPAGLLSLNAGPMFELDGSDVFQFKPGTEDRIGGIKAGAGVDIASDGTLTINLDDVEAFSFGDFTATVGTYTDSTEYALLGSVKEDEDIVIASNGTGTVCVVGELHVHKTNGTITGSLEDGAVFEVLADGQIKAYITELDNNAGALEIIGSSTGAIIAPGQPGTMLHLTGQVDEQCRFYMDGNANYASIVGRRWNGSIDSPTQVLADQDVLRINATAATDAGIGGVAMAQIRFRATEDHTTTAQGSKIEFLVTRNGTTAGIREVGLIVDNNGIEIPAPNSGVVFYGDTSGSIALRPTATAGTNTITLPAVTGTVVTTGDTGTVTNTMLAGSIANAKLANSTISGIALGSNLAALSAGNYLTGTDYDGSTTQTFAVDATTAATADKVVARDSNGTIAATNAKFATRNAGSFGAGQTLTIDMATDSYVLATITNETVTVAYTNITPGAKVTIFLKNPDVNNDYAVDSGIATTNMTNAKAVENAKKGGTSELKVHSFGTTVADLYGNFIK